MAGLLVFGAQAQTVETNLPAAWLKARHHHKPRPTPTPGPLVDPDGTWIGTSTANWSNAASWSGGALFIADGGGKADFGTIDIPAAGVTVRLQTTPRTVREIDIGDTNGDGSYAITSGGANLFFDNTANSANAQLNQRSGSNGDAISAPVVLNSSLDITNASAKTLTVSGNVSSGTAGTKTITSSTGSVLLSGIISAGSGDIAILQNGPGTLTLSGANTYGGGATVTGGILQLGTSGIVSGGGAIASGPVGTGMLTLSNGATLESTASGGGGARVIQNNLSLSGNITLGDSTNNGKLTFNSTDGTNTLGTAATIALTGNTTMTNPSTVTIADVISGGFSLTKLGVGTLNLTGANLLTGGVSVSGGTLTLGSNSAVAGGVVASGPVGTGTLALTSGATISSDSGTNRSLQNNLSLSGSVTIGDTGNNGNITFNSTALTTPATTVLLNNVTITNATTVNLNNAISGNFSLTKSGAGILNLGGANLFTGGVTINAGTVSAGSATALGPAANATLTFGPGSTGIFQLNGNDTTVVDLNTSGTVGTPFVENSASNTRTLTVTTAGTDTFAGVLRDGTSGKLSLTMSGTGSLTLSGTNTYSGATAVSSGTVAIGNDSAFGTSTLAIAGGTLTAVGGPHSISNVTTLGAGNGTIAGANDLTFTGSFSETNDRTLTVNNAGMTTLNAVNLSNNNTGHTLTVTGTGNLVLNGIVANNGTGAGSVIFDVGYAGTATINGANTYSGSTMLNAGTFVLGNKSAFGIGAVTWAGVTTSANADLSGLNAVSNISTFSGDNTFTGNNNIELSGAITNTTANILTNNISVGTLKLSGPVALSSTGANRNQTITGTGNTIISGAISNGTGGATTTSLTYTGTGSLTLSNANSYGGGTTVGSATISAGTLLLSGTGTLGASGTSATVKSGTIDLNGTTQTIGNLTMGGGPSGSASAISVNSGVLNLSGAATTVTFSSTNNANGATIAGPGSVNLNGNVAFVINDSSAAAVDLTLSASVQNGSSSGGLTKTGSGIMAFTGTVANTYTGLTTVSSGELDLNKTNGVNSIVGDGNSATADVSVTGGIFRWKSSNQVADDVTISESAGTVDLNGKTETLGTFSNSGGIFTTGKGGHLIGTGASVSWSSGTNTINADGIVEDAHVILTGGTNIVQGLAGPPSGNSLGGNLKINAGGAGLEMTGATLTLNSDTTSPGTLTLLGDVTVHAGASNIANGGNATTPGRIDLSAGTRTFTVESGASLNVSASFSNGTLNKAGVGSLELSGPNFHGATSISGGTLQADVGSLVNVTGDITVNNGGTLLISGNGRHIGANIGITLNGGNLNTGGFSEPNTAGLTIGALTLQNSSTIDLGNGASLLNFADSSSRTWSGLLTILDWSGTPVTGGGTDQLLFGTNSLAGGITAGQLAEIQFVNPDGFAAGTYTAIFDPTNLAEIIPGVAVPEPGTWLTGGLVSVGLLGAARRRFPRQA